MRMPKEQRSRRIDAGGSTPPQLPSRPRSRPTTITHEGHRDSSMMMQLEARLTAIEETQKQILDLLAHRNLQIPIPNQNPNSLPPPNSQPLSSASINQPALSPFEQLTAMTIVPKHHFGGSLPPYSQPLISASTNHLSPPFEQLLAMSDDPKTPEYVIGLPYPQGYETPKFKLFDGRKGNARAHVLQFIDALGIHGGDEEVRMREFSKSLTDRAFTWWYCHQPPGSIPTWTDLVTKFMAKYGGLPEWDYQYAAVSDSDSD